MHENATVEKRSGGVSGLSDMVVVGYGPSQDPVCGAIGRLSRDGSASLVVLVEPRESELERLTSALIEMMPQSRASWPLLEGWQRW